MIADKEDQDSLSIEPKLSYKQLAPAEPEACKRFDT